MEQDEALVVRAQQGSPEAFAALVEHHKERVYRTLYPIVANEQDAQDLAQEVFLKVYRFLPAYRGGAAFTTWLHRITVNAAHDWLRNRQRRPSQVPLALTDRDRAAHPDVPSAVAASAEDAVMDGEQSALLREALQRLPPEYREVLMLRHLHHLSYQEIGERIRAPVRTVETRLYRARSLLKGMLIRCEGGDGRAVPERATAAGRLPGR